MIVTSSSELYVFPDIFLRAIIQVETHDCDSETDSCQILITKSTFSLHKNTTQKTPQKTKQQNPSPNVHSPFSKCIFTCLPLLSKKIGKYLHM